MSLETIAPSDLKRRLDNGSVVLIDIREADEFAREHIVGARLVPLSGFDHHDFAQDRDKTAVFTCKSGNRTASNADRIIAKGFRAAYVLAGGLEGWKVAGLPTHSHQSPAINHPGQFQAGAGTRVVSGVVLGFSLNRPRSSR